MHPAKKTDAIASVFSAPLTQRQLQLPTNPLPHASLIQHQQILPGIVHGCGKPDELPLQAG
jgi:hypothetical protein